MAELLSHFWAPLCAIGSHGDRGPNAQICVSVFGASIVPDRPRLLVVLSNTNYTTGLVADTRTLAITVLAATQTDLLRPLGLASGRDGQKLGGLAYETTPAGDPYFPGGVGYLRGSVIKDFDLGDSTAFLCSVDERAELAGGDPLTWPAARAVLPPEFLTDWAAKSAREQEAARAAMLWR